MVRGNFGAIDFDDCGHGFHAYDLAVPLLAIERLAAGKGRDRHLEFKQALIEGYTTKRSWDRYDEEIFPHLLTARRLAMLGWLNSRSDNPRLKEHLPGAVERTLDRLKRDYDLG